MPSNFQPKRGELGSKVTLFSLRTMEVLHSIPPPEIKLISTLVMADNEFLVDNGSRLFLGHP